MDHPHLPPDVRPDVERIDEEVIELNVNFIYFRDLYLDAACVAILSDTAPTFFGHLQRMLLDRIISGACRLLDPADEAKKENRHRLTLEGIRNRVAANATIAAKETIDLSDRLESIRKAAVPLRIHRDNRVSHLNRSHALERFTSLPKGLNVSITATLDGTNGFMRTVHRLFKADFEVGYTTVLSSDGGVRAVLNMAKSSLAMRRLHRHEWELVNAAKDEVEKIYNAKNAAASKTAAPRID